MEIVSELDALRVFRRELSGRVGLVPTMGYLHEGHEALIHEARRHSEHVIVSVFVNPTQFGPGEDLASYPRDLEGDAARCRGAGAAALFAPTAAAMYPAGHATRVEVDGLTGRMCGASRPGHFDGVALVVTKLLNLVTPDVAVFGQKDFQQLAVIRRLVADLNMGVEVVGVATVREADGLAKSSRNRYLEGADRARAVALSEALARCWRAWQSGERGAEALLALARATLVKHAVCEDYVELLAPQTLEPLTGEADGSRGAVLALAAHVGRARLIDNLRLDGALPAELARV